MKKIITLLIAFAISSTAALAEHGDFDYPRAHGFDKQLDRINTALERHADLEDEFELSERKLMILNERKEMLELQVQVREALRTALHDLGEEATEEDREEARKAIREEFAGQFRELKDARRAVRQERREARQGADEEGE